MGKNAQGWWTRSILTFLSVIGRENCGLFSVSEGVFPSFEKNKVHPFSCSSAVSYFKCRCDVGANHLTPAYGYQPAYSNLDATDWIICFNNEQKSRRWILLLANTWLKILFVLAKYKENRFHIAHRVRSRLLLKIFKAAISSWKSQRFVDKRRPLLVLFSFW